MSLKQSGNCPRCGASIWIDESQLSSGEVPAPQYSCVCPRPTPLNHESLNKGGKVLES